MFNRFRRTYLQKKTCWRAGNLQPRRLTYTPSPPSLQRMFIKRRRGDTKPPAAPQTAAPLPAKAPQNDPLSAPQTKRPKYYDWPTGMKWLYMANKSLIGKPLDGFALDTERECAKCFRRPEVKNYLDIPYYGVPPTPKTTVNFSLNFKG